MAMFSLVFDIGSHSPQRVERLLEAVREDLGPRPDGREVITALVLASQALSVTGDVKENYQVFNLSLLAGEGVRWMDRIMNNTLIRFDYSEEGGLFHVTRKLRRCNCTEILCEHGWAARFIIQAINREGCKVGATPNIDFSALFVSAEEANKQPELTAKSAKVEEEVAEPKDWFPGETRSASHHSYRRWREDTDRLSEDMSSVLGEHLEQRTQLLENAFQELMRVTSENKKLSEKLSAHKESEETLEEDDAVSTILPNDSSTVVERYLNPKKFMTQGSTYVMKDNRTVLEPISKLSNTVEEKVVVGGFVKTDVMSQREKESVDRVYMINGLAAPFKHGRLNFLTHFHTALTECRFDPLKNPVEALEDLGSQKPINPTAELMRQVVQRTFDFDSRVVIANPFSLPFLEVGMHLTDSAILKSFDFLSIEYKATWFSQMKCLKVPNFHAEYNGFSTEAYQVKHRRSSNRSTRTSSSRHDSFHEPTTKQHVESKKKRSTILGIQV
jgi:hypothetical protein